MIIATASLVMNFKLEFVRLVMPARLEAQTTIIRSFVRRVWTVQLMPLELPIFSAQFVQNIAERLQTSSL